MKQIIKNIFNSFGIEISKIDRTNESITDVIWYNSKENADLFYASEEKVKNYITIERLDFFRKVIDLLINKHSIDINNKKIADAGCGTGHLLKFISQQYKNIDLTGFEISENALKYAKKNCSKADYYEFDIYKGYNLKFNIVMCTEVIEHLLYPGKAIEMLFEMVEKNGHLLLSVPEGRTDTFKGHINFWSEESWKVFIEQHFQNSSKIYTGNFNNNNNLYAIILK